MAVPVVVSGIKLDSAFTRATVDSWADIYFEDNQIVYRNAKNGKSRSGPMYTITKGILQSRRGVPLGPFANITYSPA